MATGVEGTIGSLGGEAVGSTRGDSALVVTLAALARLRGPRSATGTSAPQRLLPRIDGQLFETLGDFHLRGGRELGEQARQRLAQFGRHSRPRGNGQVSLVGEQGDSRFGNLGQIASRDFDASDRRRRLAASRENVAGH